MDHLFSFGEIEPIKVPVYNPIPIYTGPFHDFPQKNGLNRENLLELGDPQGKSLDEIASFFQAWLYFGFLREFFAGSVDFNEADFKSVTISGSEVITTVALPQYLESWAQIHSPLCMQDPESEKRLILSIDTLFAEVYAAGHHFIGDARSWPHDPAVLTGVPPPLALSIIVLFEALSKAARQVTHHSFGYDWQTSKLLIDNMASGGWCRSELNFLARMKIDTLYSASTMTRPKQSREHVECLAHCCFAEQVSDDETYLAKNRDHAEGCAGCADITISSKELADTINADSTPLIYFDVSAGKVEIDSVPVDRQDAVKKYFALSHVWADGLGNPVRNSWYRCQLDRVQKLMDQLSENKATKTLWWCDALCIPVGDEFKRTRQKAIVTMRQIYLNASKVLVLDSTLTKRSCHCSVVEMYITIITSSWMRRLWTFQEGFEARNLYFQFKEGVVRLGTLQSHIIESASTASEFLYWWYDNDFTEYLGIFTVDYSKHSHLVSTAIFRNAQWRSTSKQEDETLCLSTLLGLDIATLLDISNTDYAARMVWFLKRLKHFPASILFQQDPHLDVANFRWAPKSFMHAFRNSGMSWLYSRTGGVEVLDNGRGAQATLPGVLLEIVSEVTLAFETGFAFKLGGNMYFFATRFHNTSSAEKDSHFGTEHKFKSPAIILYEQPNEEGEFRECDNGVLVDLQPRVDPSEGQLLASYITLVGIVRVPGDMIEVVANHSKDFKLLSGSLLLEDQRWLIS